MMAGAAPHAPPRPAAAAPHPCRTVTPMRFSYNRLAPAFNPFLYTTRLRRRSRSYSRSAAIGYLAFGSAFLAMLFALGA